MRIFDVLRIFKKEIQWKYLVSIYYPKNFPNAADASWLGKTHKRMNVPLFAYLLFVLFVKKSCEAPFELDFVSIDKY